LKLLRGLPKVLQFIDFFENFRVAYIVTEYIDGFDLFDHIDLNVPYDEYYAKLLIKEMLECIKICHDNDIAHLDIKCENFMAIEMKPKPKLVLIDFGHAEQIKSGVVKKGLTNYGTCFYLCPEGYRKYYSSKSDSWSIGICAYLLMYGDYPFKGDDDEYGENVCNGSIKFTSKLK
jgi:serine/threonine protein kinase